MPAKKKNPGGRPKKFQSVTKLQKMIDDYFDKCDDGKKPYTVTGLALALDMSSRQCLINYEGDPLFFDTIKKAKLRVENYCEEKAHTGGTSAGPIFILKNFGWTDKQEIGFTDKDGEDLNWNVNFFEGKKEK